MKIRRFISGSPYILFNDGHLYEGNFKKGHIDLSEFLVQCRLNGFFDLKELQTAILDGTGMYSLWIIKTGDITVSGAKATTSRR